MKVDASWVTLCGSEGLLRDVFFFLFYIIVDNRFLIPSYLVQDLINNRNQQIPDTFIIDEI